MSEVKLKLTAATDVGLARQNNEDNFTVCANLYKPEWIIPQVGDNADLGEYGSLLVVADGMGGANAGEVASAIAVETIQNAFVPEKLSEVVGDDHLIQQFMTDTVKTADINILNRSEQDETTRGMGTTIVMAWLLGRRAYVCWCGDSRCYVYRSKGGLIRLSKDHSYVQGLIDRGELHPDMAIEHPLSNVITRCLGNSENRAEPETKIYELRSGDMLLLCTDGLCGLCTDCQIEEVIKDHKEDINTCRNELISAALNAGGDDNVTVALCSVMVEGEEAEEETDSDTTAEETTDDEAKELSSTVRNVAVSKTGKKIWFILLSVLIIIAGIICCIIYWHNKGMTA